MSTPRALLAGVAVLTAPILLLPLFVRPEAALGLSVAGIVAYLAYRSVAYPIAFAGIPPIVFGIFSGNPLPEGAVSVALALAVIIGVAAAVQRAEEVPPARVLAGASLILTLLLLCLLVLREPAAPETNYGTLKSAFFVISNVVFLVGGIFVGWSPGRLRLLLHVLLGVSVAGAVLLVLHVASGGTLAILPVPLTFSDGDHSISMGRQMAVGVLVALALSLGRGDPSSRLVAIASLPLLLTALVASGARGPVVAMIAGLLALLTFGLQDRAARRRMLTIGTGVVIAAAIVQIAVPSASVVRSFSFASSDVEGNSSGRTEMWAQAVREIREHPLLGIGTGGFADINPPMIYPHNIFLEAWVELGIAGMLLLTAFLAHAGWRMARAYLRAGPEDRLTVAAIAALLGAALTNALFSYALHANWELWLWAGVGTALAARLLRDRGARTPI
jgi:O-antigen ligase